MTNITKQLSIKTKSALLACLVLSLIGGVFMMWAGHNSKVLALTPSSSEPCVSAPAPVQWKHVVVLMFENKQYSSVIGSSVASTAPFINTLATKCGTAYSGTAGSTPKNNWHDANYKVDGTSDGSYASKPSYATLTSGVSPSVHGLRDDSFTATSGVDNIYNKLRSANKNGKDYVEGIASNPCSLTNRSSGDYHDAIRYYTNLGVTYCNSHDVDLSTFMTDVNNGTLPDFSMIIPKNTSNMHDNTVASGDTWAKNFLTPLLDSAQYKSGDTAIFFLWDEDTAIPNVLIAPSIVSGSKVPAPTGSPISHFSALRTWQEMLGVSPFLGDTGLAPSLLSFFNGGGTVVDPPPPDNPPAVNITSPVSGTTLTSSPVTITANATDDVGVTKVEFYDGTTLIATDTTAPYSATWNTSSLSGSRTLSAKAYDSANHVTTSGSVTVTVSNTPTCSTTPTNVNDKATMVINVNASSTSTYHVWSRMMAADSTNNSYLMQIDAACPIVVGDSTSLGSAGWTWLDYQDGNTSSHSTVSLTPGSHTITMFTREAGVKLDRVLLLSAACTPTGNGENCADTTAPTSVQVTAPTASQSVSGSFTLAATAADNSGGSGIAKVEFLIDGNVIGLDTTSPYQLAWNSTSVPDGSHNVTARATDVAGNPTTSGSISFTVKNVDSTAPTAPANLQLIGNAYNKVDISWSASTDDVGVTRYEIYRNGLSVGTVTSGTSFSDTTVSSSTSYSYTVKAWDAANNSSTASNILSVTTPAGPDAAAPSAPTNLTTTKKLYNEVDLSWTASTDNVGVTSYNVLRNGAVIGSSTTTTYIDSTVLPNTTYTYAIVARDAAGNPSTASSSISVTTPNAPDTTAPSAPASLAATTNSTQISLEWTASTDNIGVAGYKVYRDTVLIATVTTTTFDDATATAGQSYSYYVKAFDAANNLSSASNTVSATIPKVVSPPVVLNFTPTADATISKSSSTRNYGTSTELRTDNSPVYQYLLKFNVTGIGTRTVTGVNLQLYVTNYSTKGGNFYGTASTSWSESTVTWSNAPAASTSLLTSLGIVNAGQYAQINLSNYITRDGVYSLRVSTTNKDAAIFASKESATKPQLTVTAQ
jgi:fibronectin type 3 domain-containing protein